jgi:predicted N-formylglutamate amidohydrolase
MVDNGIIAAMSEPWTIVGTPRKGGTLVVCDHASNHVPEDIDLGIDAALLGQHIAYDIGVREVADYLVQLSGCAAFLGAQSRLVVDLNRYPDDASAIPLLSDGVEIIGNRLDADARDARLARFFHPYHAKLEEVLHHHPPALIVSLHSFTPRLETDPLARRPWEVGILYNEYDVAANLAIDYLEGEGLIVGDQLPYSGKLLNATMNRHAEANEIAYVGFAALLAEMAQFIVERLASETAC